MLWKHTCVQLVIRTSTRLVQWWTASWWRILVVNHRVCRGIFIIHAGFAVDLRTADYTTSMHLVQWWRMAYTFTPVNPVGWVLFTPVNPVGWVLFFVLTSLLLRCTAGQLTLVPFKTTIEQAIEWPVDSARRSPRHSVYMGFHRRRPKKSRKRHTGNELIFSR